MSVEREFETGMDEFFKAASGNNYNNMKRTFDAHQDLDFERARGNNYGAEAIRSEERKSASERDKIANQALQNAVETANMVSKQAVRHSDVAIDRQWNVDEQGYTASAIISALKPTLESVVAQILSGMTKDKD